MKKLLSLLLITKFISCNPCPASEPDSLHTSLNEINRMMFPFAWHDSSSDTYFIGGYYNDSIPMIVSMKDGQVKIEVGKIDSLKTEMK